MQHFNTTPHGEMQFGGNATLPMPITTIQLINNCMAIWEMGTHYMQVYAFIFTIRSYLLKL